MNRTTLLILFSILCAFIVITIGVFLWSELREKSEVSLLENIRERTDIIVSDRVSLGCFIPPDIDESEFNYIKNKLKSENKTLFDYCFNFKKSSVKWEDIANSIPYGIKLNGYCYDCSRKGCLCLNEDVPGFEGIDTERRSLDFGTSYIPGQIGKGFKKQSFAEIRGQPSVFVVKKGEEVKLSIYGGIFLTGQKSVEKVTAALYNGTVNESNRISTIAGEERSCYIGNNWNCYHSCRSSSSKDYCRVKCDCYTNQRYYDENSLEICKNYCSIDFKNGEATPTEISNCQTGCEEGEKMNCYRNCFIKTGNADECSGECSCYYCKNIDKSDLINYFFCDEMLSNKDEKHGCEKFLEIENSSFKIKSGEYTIFKIGDLSLTNPRYRGLAWAVANITTKEPYPGTSCYNPNNYDCYSQCCDEACEYADICCGDFNTKCKDKKKTIHIPGLTPVTVILPKCEKRCNCSTTTRTETENPFVLCKIFCSSRDGYYGNNTKIMKCQEGCDWGARQYEKIEYFGFKKDVDLVFVIDTSGSMNDEWNSLCNVMNNIKESVEKEGYKLNVTLYALGEGSNIGNVDINCPYTILNCSDINSDLGLSLNCNNGNCWQESWGPGAEWAVKNHPWRKDVLSKILFVVGDEGPYCGNGLDENDKNSVERAAQAAIDNNVTIFGLWGINIGKDLKVLFKNISEPTGGNATKFNTANPNEVIRVITDAIIRDSEFETGYDKFVNLTKNTISVDKPYVWKNVYDEVWSNLIYIVDFNSNTDWSYPCGGNWEKICTPKFNKSFELNSAIREIKKLI